MVEITKAQLETTAKLAIKGKATACGVKATYVGYTLRFTDKPECILVALGEWCAGTRDRFTVGIAIA